MTAPEPPADGPAPAASAAAVTDGRPRRGRRALGLLVAALALAVLVGPPLASAWLRAEIERRASDRIDGAVTLGGLALRWNGKVDLRDLRVVDGAGETVLLSPRGMIDVGLRSWITGRKDLAVHVYGSELDLVRDADGRWNVERLLAGAGGGADPGADPGDGDRPPGERAPDAPRQRPLDLHGRIEFADTSVIVRSPESALQLTEVTFTIGLDGPEQSTAVRLEGQVFGGTGSVGDFYADLFLWPDAGPGLEIDRIDVTDLELGVCREAMRIAGVEADERLTLGGTGEVHVTGGADDLRADAPFSLEATAEVSGLEVEYPDGAGELRSVSEGDPVRLRVEVFGAGGGAPPAVAAVLEGRGGDLRADLAADPRPRIDLRVDGAALDLTLAPLVARVHPGLPSPSRADLGSGSLGRLDAAATLVGPEAGGWGDPAAWSGQGSLRLREVDLTRSPLVASLLDGLGASSLLAALEAADLEASREEATRPLDWSLSGGRITYDGPWTWTIADVETSLTGSVGLDRTLDLRWVIPMDGRLTGASAALRGLAGETLSVGLGGSLTRPELDPSTLAELVERAAKGGIGRAIERELGLGGGADGDPFRLLREADRRWAAGERAEAAALYRRIRDEFSLSPVYLLNRDRIKARRDG